MRDSGLPRGRRSAGGHVALSCSMMLAACANTATNSASSGTDAGVLRDSSARDSVDARDADAHAWTSAEWVPVLRGDPVTGDALAPRLLSPLSTSIVSSQRPTLRWASPASSAVTVDVCRDRACAVAESHATVTGTSYRPDNALPAGVHFWRASTLDAEGRARSSFTWEFRTLAHDAPADTAFGRFNDFNGDGFADLAVTHQTQVVVFYGGAEGLRPAGGVAIELPDPRLRQSFGTTSADLNGDGYSELLVRAFTAAPEAPGSDPVTGLYVYRGSATGLATTPTSAVLDPDIGAVITTSYSAVGDENGDGYADVGVSVALPVVVGDTVDEFLPEAGVFHGGPRDFDGVPPARIVPRGLWNGASVRASAFPWEQRAADFDGDGTSDLLFANWYVNGGDRLAVSLGPTAGLATRSVVAPRPPQPPNFDVFSMASGRCDLDGDGRSEVVLADTEAPIVVAGERGRVPTSVAILRLTADLQWAVSTVTVDAPPDVTLRPMSVRCVPDLDGDGVGDLLLSESRYVGFSSAHEDLLSLLRGDPRTGGVSAPVVITRGHRSFDANGDVDGDGRSDLVVVIAGSRQPPSPDRIVVYRGRSAPGSLGGGDAEVPWMRSGEAWGDVNF